MRPLDTVGQKLWCSCTEFEIRIKENPYARFLRSMLIIMEFHSRLTPYKEAQQSQHHCGHSASLHGDCYYCEQVNQSLKFSRVDSFINNETQLIESRSRNWKLPKLSKSALLPNKVSAGSLHKGKALLSTWALAPIPFMWVLRHTSSGWVFSWQRAAV